LKVAAFYYSGTKGLKVGHSLCLAVLYQRIRLSRGVLN
jgi:hypothetical protein